MRKKEYLIRICVSGLFILFLLCSCSVKTESSERFCFGTSCKVTIYGNLNNEDGIFNGLWTLMTDLENRISCKLPYSTVSAINRGETDISDVEDSDIQKMLEVAEDFGKLTDGRFNVHIGAVTELWGIGTENASVPQEKEILEALGKDVLDLGAIGKGYASDIAAEYLKKNGVKSAIINFGGNICCIGDKKGKPFTIGIQTPGGERGTYSQTVGVSDACVVTSGAYERFFEKDGVIYCHILDGVTGYPVQSEVKSATVIGPEGLICDALSTCCFILGEEEGRALIEKFDGYSVLFL